MNAIMVLVYEIIFQNFYAKKNLFFMTFYISHKNCVN